jgi:hypothetical protein
MTTAPFLASDPWKPQRPTALVMACSDGRLQEPLDDFLFQALKITHYDRLYLPGGPGALAVSSLEIMRREQVRRELLFLVTAHQIETVVMVFHGPAADGPPEALCGDYKRRFHGRSPAELRALQEHDARDIARVIFPPGSRVKLFVFRCEVTRDSRLEFVPLAVEPQ